MQIKDLNAIILSGGMGTRIKHLLNGLPKPMVPIHHKPFIEWLMIYLFDQGIRNFHFSTGYRSEVFDEFLKKHQSDKYHISCIAESYPMGTAGAIYNAVRLLREENKSDVWSVINGDSLLLADLKQFFDLFQASKADAAMIGVEVADSSRYGTLDLDSNSYLKGFQEKQLGSGVINGGIYLLSNRFISAFPDKVPLSLENEVFQYLLDKQYTVYVNVIKAPFIDIGTPQSLASAQEFISNNLSCLNKL